MRRSLHPVLPWVGGKRSSMPYIIRHLPRLYHRYYEPFIGGGSVLLTLRPRDAVISDVNTDLMNVYRSVRDNPRYLYRLTTRMLHNDSKTYYYGIRKYDRTGMLGMLSPVARAARLIYLLRTDFNSLYRVNKHGWFNAPYGHGSRGGALDERNILRVSRYLERNHVIMRRCDFTEALSPARRGDFVYLDPPYASQFTKYSPHAFDTGDQKRLAETVRNLTNRGVYVMESNADVPLIRKLYRNCIIRSVGIHHEISRNDNSRGKAKELLMTNYDSNEKIINHRKESDDERKSTNH